MGLSCMLHCMVESIFCTPVLLTVGALTSTLAAYIFYWRVIDYYMSVMFYQNQEYKVKFCQGHMPVVGNLVQCY